MKSTDPTSEIAVQAGEPSRAGRARDDWSRAADQTWDLVRRVHLGTRRPANWVQLFKFAIVGGSGYLVNLAVFAALAEGLDVHHIPAALSAFAVAVSNNFLWNRLWTFKATREHPAHQGLRFLAVSLAGLSINLAVLALLVDLWGVAELPSQALAVAIAMPANFVGNKLWTFR